MSVSTAKTTHLDPFDVFCRAMLDQRLVPPSMRVDAPSARRARVELGDFAGHVPYLPGDDLRFLDWKALARSGQKRLRTFDEARHRRLVLVVDRSLSMASRREGLSWLLRLWCYLALYRLDSLDFVSLVGDGVRREVVAGPDAWNRMRAELVSLELAGTAGLDAMTGYADLGRADQDAVIVSDFSPLESTIRLLDRAKSERRRLLLVFPRLPHEASANDLPAGPVSFFDPETGQSFEVRLGSALHLAFLEEQRAWERRLAAACADRGHALLVATLPKDEAEALRIETWLPFLVAHR
ncbi:MAG: DUF58 domain-containing protein [Planctomycetes bacterium]|nr:DUF58 domain-containing protein [Planctomycetota bacterium]MCB9892098.1 DUF58 domain-containing protein [Planctomycetota bacterium]MCB9920330.1 DUF58 domain-containing protein [Planctomycetota bacterium]